MVIFYTVVVYMRYLSSQVFILLILDQEMDGNAVVFGLASAPGPDWLKDIIPTLGQRLKVHNDLKSLVNSQVSFFSCCGFNHMQTNCWCMPVLQMM